MEEQVFPKGILPVLPVSDIDATADYYQETLQFQENFRQQTPEGTAINAQVALEGSTLMLNLNPDKASLEGGGVYFWVRLFDKNIDEYYNSLVDAGVTIVDSIKDQFWGDRSFAVKDLNGYVLSFMQPIKA